MSNNHGLAGGKNVLMSQRVRKKLFYAIHTPKGAIRGGIVTIMDAEGNVIGTRDPNERTESPLKYPPLFPKRRKKIKAIT